MNDLTERINTRAVVLLILAIVITALTLIMGVAHHHGVVFEWRSAVTLMLRP